MPNTHSTGMSENKRKITRIIMLGDSLSDRGTASERMIWGVLPMDVLAGLKGTSPRGRFTNGFGWGDAFITMIASEFEKNRSRKILGKACLGNDDLADALIYGDSRLQSQGMDGENQTAASMPSLSSSSSSSSSAPVASASSLTGKKIRFRDDNGIINGKRVEWGREPYHLDTDFNLDNDLGISFRGKAWLKSFCEGGLSSDNYKWKPSWHLSIFFSRIVLTNLQEKLKVLLDADNARGITAKEKEQTLVMEWSGANDLITVNIKPTMPAVEKAVEARIANARHLIESGYKNIILFNLPNLACTPRFQSASRKLNAQANRCSQRFNELLEQACAELAAANPDCCIRTFDVASRLSDIYQHPEDYGFDAEKLTTPYTESADFVPPVDGLSPSSGYLFYDDVHPTSDALKWLATYCYDEMVRLFSFREPKAHESVLVDLTEPMLKRSVLASYHQKLHQCRFQFFSSSHRDLHHYEHVSLAMLVFNALHGDTTLRQAFVHIGAFDKNGEPCLSIPAMAKAVHEAKNISVLPESSCLQPQ